MQLSRAMFQKEWGKSEMNESLIEPTGVNLLLRGSVLRVCDTSMYFDSGLDIEMPPGEYSIAAIFDEAGEPIGFEAKQSNQECTREPVGEVTFAFGQIGMFDKHQADRCFEMMPDMEMFFSQLQNDLQYGCIELNDVVQVPYFRCAEGAAVVYRLLDKEKAIGILLEFGYPDENGGEE